MFPFLRRLNQRPDSYKKKFSFLVSLTVTLLIIGVWISVADINFSGDYAEAEDEQDRQQIASPFSTFKDDFVRLKTGTTEGFGNIIDSFGSVKYTAKEDIE